VHEPVSEIDADRAPEPILIVGASTRAAAFSALRAGLRPICGDLYADADLRRFAEIVPVPDYPAHLTEAVRHARAASWMYTGALENAPRQIGRLSETRTLWGNAPEAVLPSRDPAHICRILADGQGGHLDFRFAANPPPRDGAWLLKPLRGGGGRGIEIWEPAAVESRTLREPHYFQRRQIGLPISALYLAAPGGVWLLGAARQLIGLPELGARPFGYCGSLAPLPLPDSVVRQLRAVGQSLGIACGLRGLFGCDFLYDGNNAWLTELNPRYTASVELFEFTYQVPLLDWHRRACLGFLETAAGNELRWDWDREITARLPRTPSRVAGKAIVFARGSTEIASLEHLIPTEVTLESLPDFADLPMPGSRLGTGEPICTVFSQAAAADECFERLLSAARALQAEQGW
jgi:predicted ATP-grasp superfamily ATP-dependent carboligase